MDAAKAARLGADIIMFDNMRPSEIREGVELLRREGLRDRVVPRPREGYLRRIYPSTPPPGWTSFPRGPHQVLRWIDFSSRSRYDPVRIDGVRYIDRSINDIRVRWGVMRRIRPKR